ncbi:MAG TPA: VOC family protein [Blastocatellia bacterium]|nr:VOC family protein [Blastocatellia bacterium]
MATRKIYFVILLIFLSVAAFAQTPGSKILYVGSVSINPCQDAKVLADWYSKFGIETKEYQGGYYAKIDTAAGPFFFGIHAKKADAPKQCASSVSVVYRVDNFENALAALKGKGLLPYKTEKDPNEGQFAYFHDPDGNEVTLWGGGKL